MKGLIIMVIALSISGTADASIRGYATYYTTLSCQATGTSGTKTASGRGYDESAFTCALPFHPKEWGKRYKVTNLKTGKSIICTHTDYGPGNSARGRGVVIDLTPAAFKALGGKLKDGRIRVKIERI